MRKKLYLMALALVGVFILAGCQQEIRIGGGSSSNESSSSGSNRDRTLVHEIIELDAFDRIQVNGVFDVVYRQSSDHRVELHIEQHVLDQTEIGVNGNVLRVHQPTRLISGIEIGARLYIYAPTLLEANFNGVIGARGWDALDVNHFVLDVDGVSTIELNGSATNAEFNIDGVTSVSALDFQTNTMTLNVRGVSEVSVAVSDNFDVSISGVNTVRYRGNPTVNQNVDLISTLRQID